MEYDADGNEVPLSTLEAFFDTEDLTRIQFIYTNLGRSMGFCDGGHVSIHLAAHETIVAVDIRIDVLN